MKLHLPLQKRVRKVSLLSLSLVFEFCVDFRWCAWMSHLVSEAFIVFFLVSFKGLAVWHGG
jgi:hypothetical protein